MKSSGICMTAFCYSVEIQSGVSFPTPPCRILQLRARLAGSPDDGHQISTYRAERIRLQRLEDEFDLVSLGLRRWSIDSHDRALTAFGHDDPAPFTDNMRFDGLSKADRIMFVSDCHLSVGIPVINVTFPARSFWNTKTTSIARPFGPVMGIFCW